MAFLILSLSSLQMQRRVASTTLWWKPEISHSTFFLGWLTFEGGTDKLSQNVGKQLPTYATQRPRRTKVSTTPL
jgi:hypothetical protein